MTAKQKSVSGEAPRGDDSGIFSLLLRFGWVMLAASLGMLFLSILGFAEGESVAHGLSGAAGLGRRTVMVLIVGAVCAWLHGRSHSGKAFWDSAWPVFLIFCVFLGYVTAFTAAARLPHTPGMITGNDAPQYFVWLHTWIFDWDVHFEEDFAGMPGIGEMMTELHPDTPDWNVAPIGTPLLWLPFYLAAHLGTGLLNLAGAGIAANGLTSPYAAATGFGSNVLVFVGMLLVYFMVKRHASGRAAFFSVMALYGATPLIAYLVDEVWMSHGASFFAGALVAWLWDRYYGMRSARGWVLLGSAIGLAMLVRPAHVALLILPAVECFFLLRTDSGSRGELFRRMASCVGAAVGVFSLQLLTWLLRSGFEAPPGSPMQWFTPSILSILFSTRNGLFAWHPLTWLGFLGLPLVWRQSRSLALGFGGVLLLTLYFNSAIANWWGGAAFGMRRFVGVLPFMAPGIALSGSWMVHNAQRFAVVIAVVLLGALTMHNHLLRVQYRDNWFQPEKPLSFAEVLQQNARLLHHQIGNPTSYPANLLYALWNGVPVAQYDVLGGMNGFTPFDFDQNNPRLRSILGTGWETDFKTTFVAGQPFVAVAEECTLRLPLEQGRDYTLHVTLAYPPGMTPTQQVAFLLNGNAMGGSALAETGQSLLKLQLKAADVAAGLNTLTMKFTKALDREYAHAYGIPVKTKPARKVYGLLYRVQLQAL